MFKKVLGIPTGATAKIQNFGRWREAGQEPFLGWPEVNVAGVGDELGGVLVVVGQGGGHGGGSLFILSI